MSIGVIGYGVVGSATAEVLQRLGYAVVVNDPDARRVDAARTAGHGHLENNLALEALFLCVPEGSVRHALASAPNCAITVIRSTVRPGVTDQLSEEFRRPLAFMPEFLREATALWDSLNPPFILIGCRQQEQGDALVRLFAPLLAPTVVVAPPTAEMTKLTLNTYLHTLISFWNEVDLICAHAGIESHIVGKLCSQDPRVSKYGALMHGKPVGGRCLPKDLSQLITFARDEGYVPELLEAVRCVNDRITKPDNGASSLDRYRLLSNSKIAMGGRRG